jgi:spore coat protein CotF
MKAREFLSERGININIPINITIPGDGEDISVNAGATDAPKNEDGTEQKYSVSPLQQELELLKAEQGKKSALLDQITTEDEYSNPMSVQDHLEDLKKIYKETQQTQEG